MRPILWEMSIAANKRLFTKVLDDISNNATSRVLVFQSISCDNSYHRIDQVELYQQTVMCITVASDTLPVRKAYKKTYMHVG